VQITECVEVIEYHTGLSFTTQRLRQLGRDTTKPTSQLGLQYESIDRCIFHLMQRCFIGSWETCNQRYLVEKSLFVCDIVSMLVVTDATNAAATEQTNFEQPLPPGLVTAFGLYL